MASSPSDSPLHVYLLFDFRSRTVRLLMRTYSVAVRFTILIVACAYHLTFFLVFRLIVRTMARDTLRVKPIFPVLVLVMFPNIATFLTPFDTMKSVKYIANVTHII